MKLLRLAVGEGDREAGLFASTIEFVAAEIRIRGPEFLGLFTLAGYARSCGEIYQSQKFGDITFVNDLERPVFEKFVFLAHVKSWLLKQPEVGAALMSGSGSTIFAVLRSNVDGDLVAKRAKSELDPELWSCVCDTL